MIRYKNVAVSAAAGETLSDALAGLGERKRKIHALIVAGNASTTGLVNGVDLRCYKNQDQIVDYNLNAWLSRDSDNAYEPVNVPIRIPVDILLESGDGLKVGFNGNFGGDVIIEYSDV